ncbi:MAG: HNH endonuclease [Ruminiclostridium sp.]|nr:HNH endonuclease [Ruminiclostridium sp.]
MTSGGQHSGGGQPKLASFEDKLKSANRNEGILSWQGEPGNSKRVPDDPDSALAKALAECGVDGIVYKDGDVDFTPVSKFDVKFNDFDGLYAFLGETISIGSLKTRGDLRNRIRSRWQALAKNQLVDRINSDPEFAADIAGRTGIDISGGKMTSTRLSEELSRVGLTLHETPDCGVIQFVPTLIHEKFRHLGGVAEMSERALSGDLMERIRTVLSTDDATRKRSLFSEVLSKI